MIAVGQKLPNATLYEFMNEESEGCSLGPNAFEVEELLAGKKIVIFALPGAFTPTCSAKHVPGYVEHYDGSTLDREAPGKFEVSDAASILKKL